MYVRWVLLSAASMALVVPSVAWAQFAPGHVFIVEAPGKFCGMPEEFGSDRIWEIDPQTGQATLFAQIPDELCGFLTGLAFTPDGKRLRASSFLRHEILEFDSEGNFTVVLDSTDGIACPWGFNNIAYDAAGNFYVVSSCFRDILRFPVDGGPPTVFADAADGVSDGAAIAFASDGDLYLTTFSLSTGHILLRVGPDGNASIFDTFGAIGGSENVTTDASGHVYVGLRNGQIFRYLAGIPESKELLVSGPWGGRYSMAMSPDQSKIYVNDAGPGAFEFLFAVDVVDGTFTTLAEIPFNIASGVTGIAVSPVPPPPPIPTLSGWLVAVMALLVLTAGTMMIQRHRAARPRGHDGGSRTGCAFGAGGQNSARYG